MYAWQDNWQDYYEVLGIDRSATDEEIQQAWTGFTIAHHPDKFKSDAAKKRAEAKFKLGNEAHSVLSNPSDKADYDKTYDAHLKKDPPVLEVDNAYLSQEVEEGQAASFSFTVRHVSGKLPTNWALGIKVVDGNWLDSAFIDMSPKNAFPTKVSVRIPAQSVGDYSGALEVAIVELT
ncbi:MAG: DnaJ domain-containing protein [Candidatus Levyibacteriota bacterium]|jgi:curved DNA-binding protein CbpA